MSEDTQELTYHISMNAKARCQDVLAQVTEAQRSFRTVVEKYNTFIYGLAVGMDVDLETHIFDEKLMAFVPKPEPEPRENGIPQED